MARKNRKSETTPDPEAAQGASQTEETPESVEDSSEGKGTGAAPEPARPSEMPPAEAFDPAGDTIAGEALPDPTPGVESGESRDVPVEYVSQGHRVILTDDGRWVNGSGVEYRCRSGHAFDPEIHQIENGQSGPAISVRGLIKRIPGAKKAKPRREAPPEPPPLSSTLPPGAETPPDSGAAPGPDTGAPPPLVPGPGSPENDAQAKALAGILVGTMGGLVGAGVGEWAKPAKDERSAMEEGWFAYLRTVDCSSVPPWAVPIMASIPWASRVLTDERYRERAEARRRERILKRAKKAGEGRGAAPDQTHAEPSKETRSPDAAPPEPYYADTEETTPDGFGGLN